MFMLQQHLQSMGRALLLERDKNPYSFESAYAPFVNLLHFSKAAKSIKFVLLLKIGYFYLYLSTLAIHFDTSFGIINDMPMTW